ncbi:MAG TPA: DnaJ domain-containing protein [Blastocatellia bacterium]|nr:DnaJ domain-containing protein [Blastocatellia bacterium]
MQGQLGEKLIADLIREVAAKRSSGLLRLSRGKAIKAIFFDSGEPVYAISNISTEQLDHKLIGEGAVTPEQIARALELAGTANRLGPALVDIGALTDEQMRRFVSEQVMAIIVSLFEWTQGEYLFDERIRAAHDVTLGASAVDILLVGARHAAVNQQMADAIAPPNALVTRGKAEGFRLDTGKLVPVESYLLSRIESSIQVSEVGPQSGIPEEEAHRAVCTLVSSGFLRLIKDEADSVQEQSTAEEIAHLREEISRKLHFYNSADYYEVLGVTRQATTGDVKAAYYQLAKKLHPDRYRKPEYSDLKGKLEALFARITQAYETLSDSGQRAAYDDKIRKPTGTLTTGPLPTGTLSTSALSSGNLPNSGALKDERKQTGALRPPPSQPAPQKASSEAPAPDNQQQGGSGRSAEHCYQQGRARFDRKEYHAAVHLLKEAIKLDPSKPAYHFHLGMALIRNPRTRREAEQHLVKATELDPYNSQIRAKLGLLYKEVGLPKKAEHFFREALELDPDNRAALRELSSSSKKGEVDGFWKGDLGSIAKRFFKK